MAKAVLIQLRGPPGKRQWGARCTEWARQTHKQMGKDKWRCFTSAGTERIAFARCSTRRHWHTMARGPNPTT